MTEKDIWKKVGTLVISLAVLMSFTSIPLAAAQSTQSPTFSIQSYPLLGNSHIAVDLNGDGILDLALSLGWGFQGMIEILKGNGNGTFQPLVLYDPAPPQFQ